MNSPDRGVAPFARRPDHYFGRVSFYRLLQLVAGVSLRVFTG
jgi:hypothetical protein